jgi:ribosomal-protein-alanine N-acetyltransferase
VTDADVIAAAIGDGRVARMLARVPHPYRRADALSFIASTRRQAQACSSLNLSIVHCGELIGGIGISAIPNHNEFGYWLARTHWGRGFATEAGGAVLDYAFTVLGLRLVRSGVFTDNSRSRRVQAKLGFRHVGISRRRSLARGTMVDHIDTVLTRRRHESLAR